MNKMNFTAQELRNGKHALLRKVQRNLDNEKTFIETPKEDVTLFSRKSNSLESKDNSFFEERQRKKTRLGLLKIRGGRL